MSTITAPTSAPSTPPLTPAAVFDNALGVVLDSIVAVERMMASLTAYRAVAINEVHQLALAAESPTRPGVGRPWSAKTMAWRVATSELATATRISEREAQQLVADSAALVDELPATLDALRSGSVSYRHASILIDEARSLPSESWASFEAVALPEAETRTPAGFRQRARVLREREHPASLDERRREAAWGFIKWAASAEVQRRFLDANVGVFTRRSVVNDPALRARFPFFSVVDESLANGDADFRPRIPQYPQIQDLLGTAVNAVLVGTADPQRALDDAQARAARLF